jgi:hypothetical protein
VAVKEASRKLAAGSQRRDAVSRRSLPGNSQPGRRVEAGGPLPRRPDAGTPFAKPGDEPGVLWDVFREAD